MSPWNKVRGLAVIPMATALLLMVVWRQDFALVVGCGILAVTTALLILLTFIVQGRIESRRREWRQLQRRGNANT